MHNAHRSSMLAAALIALLAPALATAHDHDASAQDPHLRASQPEQPSIPSPVSVQLGAQALSGLPRQTVEARVHQTELACEGVPLIELLRASGVIPRGPLRSAQLSRYVLADARDGYRVLFSLAELDPGTGNRGAYVVDRCNGTTLGKEDGPLRLLVPGDVRAARSVRQLDAITVVVAP